MNPLQIDPSIYGPQEVTATKAGVGATITDAASIAEPTKVPQEQAVLGTTWASEGAAQLAHNNRDRASALESVGASISEWTTSNLVRAAQAPSFEPEAEWNPHTAIKLSGKSYPKEQDESLLNTRSADEFNYKLGNIERVQQAHEAMGDNPVVSTLAAFADPVWFAVDAASMGAARAVRLAGAGSAVSRATAGAAGFAGAAVAGKVAQTQTLAPDAEVWLGATLMGAVGAVFHNGAGLVPKDAEFPAAALTRINGQLERDLLGDVVPASSADFVGPLPEVQAPGTVMTESRVPATGEGPTTTTYGARTAPGVNVEYHPTVPMSQAEQSALQQSGKVHFVESTDDIGQYSHDVATGRVRIDEDAKAVYLPGDDKVILIKGNIKPGDDMKGILLHEVGVHMNAERVLGTSALSDMLTRLEDLAIAGNSRAKQAFADVPKGTHASLVREEALGYYIERNHGNFADSFVSQMVAGIKAKLRDLGFKSLKLSEADIVYMLRKSAKGKAESFDATFPYAWHGSPTKGIPKLDTAFMGKGEGAQAFGWGHYITSEKGTALAYRNKEALRRGQAPESGGLYRVKLQGTIEDYLDLEARAQSTQVEAALASLGVRSGVTGKSAYDYLAKTLGSPQAASEALLAAGVQGARYSTGRTRMQGVQSSNFVAYGNSAVDITARYSKGLGLTTQQQAARTVAQKTAQALEISLHKTMSNLSAVGSKIADTLLSDPLNSAATSVANVTRAARADMSRAQYVYEELLGAELATQGAGLYRRITQPGKSAAIQRNVEKEVYMELLRRNRLALDGLPVTPGQARPSIIKMANAHEAATDLALAERKRAGVLGSDAVTESRGYVTRRWDISKIEKIEEALIAAGQTAKQARESTIDTVSIGIQRANGWDAELSGDVAKAIIDRARDKGYFADTAFKRTTGADGLAELKNLLVGSGISPSRMQRVLDTMSGKADEAGKNSTLKHRVDIAMDEAVIGTSHTVADMLDTSVSTILERYLDGAAADVGFATKGLTDRSAVQKMRSELLESIDDVTKRGEAAKLFDNSVAALRGEPVGEDMHAMMRASAALTQMVSLGASALWQVTEYATTMARFGAARTFNAAARELPIIRQIIGDKFSATHLREVISSNGAQDLRIRPYINRMEDGFEIPASAQVQLALQQAKQLVPYLNAMKYVQAHQSRMAGNLITSMFRDAARGNSGAAKVLADYGLESHLLARVSADITQHGMDTALWSKSTWDAVRPTIAKMTDEVVLRANTGDIPAFAQFTQVGKFVFTFRGFVLSAHNKVLAGEMQHHGFAGISKVMLYQYPLTMMMTAANNTIAGRKPMDDNTLAKTAMTQMGSLGLLSEFAGMVTGTKQQFGSPGTIAIDKVYKFGNAVSTGDVGNISAAALSATPLLSVILPTKALGEALKGN